MRNSTDVTPSRAIEPKVSVLVVTYNHESYIAQAIESAVMQKTDFPYEIIVGEDCSTDSTREIVQKYARKYPAMIRTFFPERNIGLHRNFREVFRRSRGRYLAVLEGDDYWTSPNKLQIQTDILDSHPGTVICCHHCVKHYQDGSRSDEAFPRPNEGVYELQDVLGAFFIHFTTVLFRRVIDDLPDWYHSLPAGDIALFVTLARYGNIRLLPETMSVWRIHPRGAWSRLDELAQRRGNRDMYRLFYQHLDAQYRSWLRRKIFSHSYDIGMDSFAAGDADESRRCLRDCLKYSGLFDHLPQKLWLAFKAYCGWIFALRRQLRRARA